MKKNKKHITMQKIAKNDKKDLNSRADAANAEIKKILEKYELGLGATPHFQQLPGQPAFVISTQVQLFDARPAVQTQKLAEA